MLGAVCTPTHAVPRHPPPTHLLSAHSLSLQPPSLSFFPQPFSLAYLTISFYSLIHHVVSLTSFPCPHHHSSCLVSSHLTIPFHLSILSMTYLSLTECTFGTWDSFTHQADGLPDVEKSMCVYAGSTLKEVSKTEK